MGQYCSEGDENEAKRGKKFMENVEESEKIALFQKDFSDDGLAKLIKYIRGIHRCLAI